MAASFSVLVSQPPLLPSAYLHACVCNDLLSCVRLFCRASQALLNLSVLVPTPPPPHLAPPLLTTTPPTPHTHTTQALEFLKRKLAHQTAHAAQQETAMNEADRLWAQAKLEQHQLVNTAAELAVTSAAEQRTAVVAADALVETERRAGLRFEARRRAKEAAAERLGDMEQQVAEAQVRGAEEGQRAATRRLQEALRDQNNFITESAPVVQSAFDRRAQAVLSLKKNSELALDELKGQNEKRLKREGKLLAKQEAEKESLFAEGHNAYEVFRRRAQEQKTVSDKAALVEKQRVAELVIAERMINEDEYQLHQQKEERKHRELEQAHLAALGRHVTELRAKEYMQKATKDGVEMVDPTGR